MEDTQSQYSHTNSKGVTYYLNTKLVTLRGGTEQRIYYFSKAAGLDTACDLPEGKVIKESPRNAFLTVSKPVEAV